MSFELVYCINCMIIFVRRLLCVTSSSTIFGILLWYPLPFISSSLHASADKHGSCPGWSHCQVPFAVFYLLLCFLLLPSLVLGLSLAGWWVMVGVGAPLLGVTIFIAVVSMLQAHSPRLLPAKLQNWDFLPQWMSSLRPLDRQITRATVCCSSPCEEGQGEEDEEYISTQTHSVDQEKESVQRKEEQAYGNPVLDYPDESRPGVQVLKLKGLERCNSTLL